MQSLALTLKDVFRKSQARAKANGISDMTLDEINEIIYEVRAESTNAKTGDNASADAINKAQAAFAGIDDSIGESIHAWVDKIRCIELGDDD